MKAFTAMLKKDMRLYGRRMLSMLILMIFLIAGCAAALLAAIGSAAAEREKTALGLVDNDASTLSKMAINVVKSSDAVGDMFTVDDLESAEEAIAKLKEGKLDGAIIFSEDYLSDILDGDSSAVRIVLSDSLSDSAQTILHFAKTGEKLIKVAEYGVMSAWRPLQDNYPYKEASRMLNEMEVKYALRLLSLPEDAFEYEELPFADSSVGLVEYYLLSFTVFLLIIIEVIFFPYTAGDCAPSLLRRIKSYGIGNTVIIIEKAVLPFIIRALLFCGIIALISSFTYVEIGVMSVCLALFCLILLSLIMSSLSVLLSQTPLGLAMIFALASAGLLLSGGLIPVSMLPHSVTAIGSFTPSGLALNMLSPLLFGSVGASELAIMTIMCALLIFAASMFIRRITERGGTAK